MTSIWLDCLNALAAIVTIAGIPVVAVTTFRMYREFKKAREPENVSHGCLEFYDTEQRCAVNLVPLNQITTIPRSGDRVLLPGEIRNGKIYGGGNYQVLKVEFCYVPAPEVDQPCPALPAKIVADVRNLSNFRSS